MCEQSVFAVQEELPSDAEVRDKKQELKFLLVDILALGRHLLVTEPLSEV